jgi:hypothetical protein
VITAEHLRELLHYDPETGVFTWIMRGPGRRLCGTVGSVNPLGYQRIAINRRYYQAHRLAWLYVHGEWPVGDIDHINGDPGDNRIANLRPATRSQNLANSKRRKNNTSGYKGVSWNKQARKWHARIGVDGQYKHLGLFTDPAEAHEAWLAAAKKTSREFARAE